MTLANQLIAPVAPVGYAWLTAWLQNPQLDLWQADGSHPTEQGTYLAACVFYAVLFRQSPENNSLPCPSASCQRPLLAKCGGEYRFEQSIPMEPAIIYITNAFVALHFSMMVALTHGIPFPCGKGVTKS